MGLIHCLGFIPRASLMMKTGQPVMRPGSLVTLQIEHEDGLQGWRCWVYRGGKIKYYKLRLRNDTVRLSFSPTSVVERENIFWCTDKEQQQRSNQIIVQTSGNDMQQKNVFGFTNVIHCFLSNIKSAIQHFCDPFVTLKNDDGKLNQMFWQIMQLSSALENQSWLVNMKKIANVKPE